MSHAIPKPPEGTHPQLADTYAIAMLELGAEYVHHNKYTTASIARLSKTLINGCRDMFIPGLQDSGASRLLNVRHLSMLRRKQDEALFLHNATLCALPELANFLVGRASKPHSKQIATDRFDMSDQVTASLKHVLTDTSGCAYNRPHKTWPLLGQLTLASLLGRHKDAFVLPSLPQFNNPKSRPGVSGFSAVFIENQGGELATTPVQVVSDCVGICPESDGRPANPDTLTALQAYNGSVRYASMCCDLQMPSLAVGSNRGEILLPQLVLKDAQGSASAIEREVLDLVSGVALQAIHTNRFAQAVQA